MRPTGQQTPGIHLPPYTSASITDAPPHLAFTWLLGLNSDPFPFVCSYFAKWTIPNPSIKIFLKIIYVWLSVCLSICLSVCLSVLVGMFIGIRGGQSHWIPQQLESWDLWGTWHGFWESNSSLLQDEVTHFCHLSRPIKVSDPCLMLTVLWSSSTNRHPAQVTEFPSPEFITGFVWHWQLNLGLSHSRCLLYYWATPIA